MTARCKFMCSSVEMYSPGPRPTVVYTYRDNVPQSREVMSWARTFKFVATYDPKVPEDKAFSTSTPSGELRVSVSNPAIEFEPGKSYYIDITEAKEASQQ